LSEENYINNEYEDYSTYRLFDCVRLTYRKIKGGEVASKLSWLVAPLDQVISADNMFYSETAKSLRLKGEIQLDEGMKEAALLTLKSASQRDDSVGVKRIIKKLESELTKIE
jgi:hypothetical protein